MDPATNGLLDWLITNRGGLAQLSGLMMVPSQLNCPDGDACRAAVAEAAHNLNGWKFNNISLYQGLDKIHGVVCYPPNFLKGRCVVYNNPNGQTLAGYFEQGELKGAPAAIAALRSCPLYLYDYRGTGLNQKPGSHFTTNFKPTYETIVEDGEAYLANALDRYNEVEVWGNSLGGAVSLLAAERYLEKQPKDVAKLSLFNIDCFSTTSRVIWPAWPRTIDFFGWCVGGYIDAFTALKKLADRGIKITVLCHEEDPVIPKGARMIEVADAIKNVILIRSPLNEHATLSPDMIEAIKEKENPS